MFNPLVPDAHYSERHDKPFSIQIQQLEVDLKLNLGFFIFCTLGTNGLKKNPPQEPDGPPPPRPAVPQGPGEPGGQQATPGGARLPPPSHRGKELGTFAIFFIFSLLTNYFFAFFIKVITLHQSYFKSPVKLT